MSIPTQEERENEEAIFAQVRADYARAESPLEKEFREMVGDAIAQHWPPKEGWPK